MTEIEKAENQGYDLAMSEALVVADKAKYIPRGCKAAVCNFGVIRETFLKMKEDRQLGKT